MFMDCLRKPKDVLLFRRQTCGRGCSGQIRTIKTQDHAVGMLFVQQGQGSCSELVGRWMLDNGWKPVGENKLLGTGLKLNFQHDEQNV